MFSGNMKSKIHPHSELYGIITLKILWTGTYLTSRTFNLAALRRSYPAGNAKIPPMSGRAFNP